MKNENINSVSNLSTATQELIREALQTELLKRGFQAPLTVSVVENRNSSGARIEVTSELFQTTPVLFKEIRVGNFGGSISLDKESEKFLHIWLPIYAEYQHFAGGSNGCELFTFTCDVPLDREVIWGAKAN